MDELKYLQGSTETIGAIPEINFGKIIYEETEGPGCVALKLENVPPKVFAKYVSDVAQLGYICQERHCLGDSSFYAFVRKDAALYLN